MEKKIEDYLHLYVGCECETPFGTLVLSYFQPKGRYKAWFNDGDEKNKEILHKNELIGKCFFLTEFKPILRPLSSMTEDEKSERAETVEFYPATPVHKHIMTEHETPETFRWYLSKGFDLFGLIESGLAVEKLNP